MSDPLPGVLCAPMQWFVRMAAPARKGPLYEPSLAKEAGPKCKI